MDKSIFNLECRYCPRLAGFLDEVQERYPGYHCRPVPPFGDSAANFLIVGLAPGMHGANATGRPFTGDHAGILLYKMLHQFGFSTHAESVAVDDDLVLTNCRITNAVKCLPPDNKPIGAEINTCNTYLANELGSLPKGAVVLALGGIAHRAVVKALGYRQVEFKFGHESLHDLGDVLLLDSYHCSRYNTNTRRLTPHMFASVFSRAKALLER